MKAIAELNLIKLLTELENSKSFGCLKVEGESIYWHIYLQQGKLTYIDCSAQLIDQLKYYLHFLGLKQVATALKDLPSLVVQASLQDKSSTDIYSKAICWLIAEKHLNQSQGLKLIEEITKDALQSCTWLEQGVSNWQQEVELPSWICEQLENYPSLNISECLNTEKNRLAQWQNCSEQLLSVHQRPYFNSGWEHKTLPTSGSLSVKNLQELAKVIRGRTSIRELSILLQKDELQVAQFLSPYINHQIVCLRNPQPILDRLPNVPRITTKNQRSRKNDLIQERETVNKQQNHIQTKKIVCIDDSPTILKEIKRFLNQEQFEVTAIEDPVQAVPIIFRLKPDLILLDITMPKINGYKLCSLLRNSQNCNETPIIMVTGNTGFIDKARAKISGATDYFTKPFTQESLMQIVEKYLN